eukprot:gene15677-21781_t
MSALRSPFARVGAVVRVSPGGTCPRPTIQRGASSSHTPRHTVSYVALDDGLSTQPATAESKPGPGYLVDEAWDTEPVKQAKVPAQIQGLLDEFESLIKEFRFLESRIKPWADTFASTHGGTRPTSEDAEEHGGTGFAKAFKEFAYLRKRIFFEIPAMRQRMRDELEATARHGNRKAQGRSAKNINIDHSVPTRSQLSGQLAQVQEYRRKTASRQAAKAKEDEAKAKLLALDSLAASLEEAQPSQSSPSVEACSPAADVVTEQIQEPTPNRLASAIPAPAVPEMVDEQDERSADLLASSGSGSSRMKSAAMAALAYRKKKAQASPDSSTLIKRGKGPAKLPEVSIERAQFV